VAHRGFVQSGFNDIPHPAAGLIQPRDLVEPSSIPTKSARHSDLMSAGDSEVKSAGRSD
jgi:hypothetical protein